MNTGLHHSGIAVYFCANTAILLGWGTSSVRKKSKKFGKQYTKHLAARSVKISQRSIWTFLHRVGIYNSGKKQQKTKLRHRNLGKHSAYWGVVPILIIACLQLQVLTDGAIPQSRTSGPTSFPPSTARQPFRELWTEKQGCFKQGPTDFIDASLPLHLNVNSNPEMAKNKNFQGWESTIQGWESTKSPFKSAWHHYRSLCDGC